MIAVLSGVVVDGRAGISGESCRTGESLMVEARGLLNVESGSIALLGSISMQALVDETTDEGAFLFMFIVDVGSGGNVESM